MRHPGPYSPDFHLEQMMKGEEDAGSLLAAGPHEDTQENHKTPDHREDIVEGKNGVCTLRVMILIYCYTTSAFARTTLTRCGLHKLTRTSY